jgi:leader peptidase (prepilin peptidase)/N-methyltransferase
LSLLIPLLFAVTGACLASFIQVVAERTLAERPWWGAERSVCGTCGAVLPSRDLIPLLSFLWLRGRCRACGAPIPRSHPILEALGALFGLGIALRWGASAAGALALLFGALLLLNALTDHLSGYVYDLFAGSLVLLGAGFRLFGGLPALGDGALGGAFGFGLIALIILISRGGMGWGDAWFLGGVGTVLGLRLGIAATWLGFFAGGVAALALLAAGRVTRKSAVPLVPFLALGGLLALFVGPALLAWFGFPPSWPWSR